MLRGFVGGHLAAHYLKKGWAVVSIQHDDKPITSSKLLGIHDKITWCRGDLLDESLPKRVIADYEVEQVIHCAALPIVRTGHRTSTPIFSTNVMGTINLLEAVKEQHLSGYHIQFCYFSSDKAYGYSKSEKPYTEDTCLSGLNIYDCSKAMADLAVQCYYHTFGIPTAIVRCCNIFGIADLNSRLIPNTIRNCLAGKPPVIFKDVHYVREFVYADDVCDAVDLVMQGIDPQRMSIYNIGSGIWMDQEECIREILKFFPDLQPVYEPPPEYTRIEIPYQRLDTTKIEGELGWKAKFTFEEGLKRTVNWYKRLERRLGRHCPFESECRTECMGYYEHCPEYWQKPKL